MLTRSHLLRTAVFFCCLAAGSAFAQDPAAQPSAAPANLAFVDGIVDLVHEGVVESADPPVILVDGDVVRTRNGRAEIVFADGTLLHLDLNAELEILAPERIRLLNGRALLRVSAAASRPYFVDTPAATVRLDSRGEYGVGADLQRGDLEVTVARGIAEIDDGTERTVLRAGEMLSLATRGTRPVIEPFNSAVFSSFAQWSNARTNGFSAAHSAAQLPSELRPYAPMLDEYGRWDYVAPHGQVWFPSVGVAWRPYYDGWWDHTRYGWTWHGRDRWAWPTHHYGRWGFNGSFWYWIPATAWAPAWVSWGYAPGYVSWSPLGWDGHPVIGFGAYRHAGHGLYDPWRSWTVVPRDNFGRRRLVRTHAINGNRIDDRVRRSLIVQNAPPASPPGFAVSRSAVSLPGATGGGRRQDPNVTRDGNVRRPSAAAGTGSPASSGETAPTPGRARSRAAAGGSVAPAAPEASAAPAAPVAPLAPGYRARPGTERTGEAGDSRRGRVRSDDPRSTPAPPPAEATAPATGAQPRDGEGARPAPASRGGGSTTAAEPPPSRYGEGGGNVRRAEPRSEPRAASPPSQGTTESGGARQRPSTGSGRPEGSGGRGGSVATQPQGSSQQGGASGGAARRRPGSE